MAALSSRTSLVARASAPRAARVKPFSSGAFKAARRVALKAAEAEASAEQPAQEVVVDGEAAPAAEEDFSFSLSDARRGNEYSTSDVEAALRFYTEGQGSLIYNDEFAKNDFVATVEDSAFFDDLDNNEGWEEDPYAGVGIPEAAPKRKRKDKEGADAEEEDDDDAELRAIEEAKLAVDDELEEVEAARRGEHGPWEWDMEDKDEARAVAPEMELDEDDDAMLSDNAILAGVATANMDAVEESMQELMGFVVEEVPLADIDALYEPGPADAELNVSGSVLSGEEAGRIDALLAEKVEDAKLSDDILFGNDDGLEVADDGLELDESMVKEYLASLKAAAAGSADAAALAEFATEAAGKEDAVSAADLALAAEAIPAGNARLMADDQLPAIEAPATERADIRLYNEMAAEYKSLEDVAVQSWAESGVMDETEVEILEQYLDNTAEYMAAMAGYEEPVQPQFDEGRNGVLAGLVGEDLEDEPMPLAYGARSDAESFQERVLELSRVTKVVKGGKLMGFRAVVVIGNLHGKVGVGCSSGREVSTAVKRALVDARKNVVTVPITSSGSIPHRVETKQHSAKVVVVPASEGTGCIAGGAVRSVLELAGVRNCLSKRLGTRNMLNNARATIKALTQLKTLEEVSRARGVPMTLLMK